MNATLRMSVLTLALVPVLAAVPLHSQSLAARVRAAPAGRVQFEFPGRAGVCGDGQTFMSTGGQEFYGRVNVVDGISSQTCAPGPVRVVLDRADGMVTGVDTYAGPLKPADGVTDLGTVTASDASGYLFSIANGAEGRASHDAVMPAAIADGADPFAALLALVRSQDRPLETRRAALSWLGRADEAHLSQTASSLLAVARDGNESQQIRQHALSVLARLAHGAGIPMLTQLARDAANPWAAGESLRALSASGDPRARQFLRETIQRADIPDAELATAIRGLGNSYATGQDIDLLRASLAKAPGDRSRAAVLEAISRRGSASDAQWLLGVARDVNQQADTRRRALDLAARAGTTSAQMLTLYDAVADPVLRESLIRIYGQAGDRASVEKLISIAKTDSDYALRRRAVASLARTQDPRAREALQEISVR